MTRALVIQLCLIIFEKKIRSVASSYFSGVHFGGHSGGPGTGIGHYYPGGHHLNRLEVGADVHTTRKKYSLSSERLSETVSLSERSATVSLAEEGGGNSAAASTRALAGSLLAYKVIPLLVAVSKFAGIRESRSS